MLYLSCVKIGELYCPAKTEHKLAPGGWHSANVLALLFFLKECLKGSDLNPDNSLSTLNYYAKMENRAVIFVITLVKNFTNEIDEMKYRNLYFNG